MIEENNIEEKISKKFYDCSSKYDIYEWLSFIGKIDLSELKSTLIIVEIDFNLDLENWKLEQFNFEFIIKKKSNINFQNCSFNSLNIISSDKIILNDIVIHKCIFVGDLEINIKAGSSISLSGSKFHGKKCSINSSNSSHQISLTGTEFGFVKSDNKGDYKNDFELQIFGENAEILTSKDPNEWTQFSANNFILKTNLKKISFQQYKFNVNKFVIEGVEGKKSLVDFCSPQSGIIAEYTKEIELKNLTRVRNLCWQIKDEDVLFNGLFPRLQKLSFENVRMIAIDSLKNIELSGYADYISGKFEDCNFENISGKISAEIYGQSKFINCKNITTKKEISIKLDGNKGSSNNPHNITIENSTITKLHFSQNHKLCVKDSSLIDIILNKCDLLKIEDSKITNITLENCQFNDSIILNNATFLQSPHISNIKFSSHNVEMRNLKFKDNSSSQASGSYRALMKVCQDAGYENGVIFFHAKELETRHNYLKNNIIKSIKKFKIFSFFDDFIEIFLLLFHKYFSKYGASLFLPLLWIFVIFILLIPCYLSSNKGVFYLAFSIIEVIKLSLKNSLGPLIFALPKEFIKEDFLKSLPSSIKILCFLQTVICSSIWFVWFFMVRRRFKI
jgi:hypothetical protein